MSLSIISQHESRQKFQERTVNIFSYVGNPHVLQHLNKAMKAIVDRHLESLYAPIYRQILKIEGVDLVTFEREKAIDPNLSIDLKVKKAWDDLKYFRISFGLQKVVFHQRADSMVQRYQEGHLELQPKLVISRVKFWMALNPKAVDLGQYSPLELGQALRSWMQKNCDPNTKVLTFVQNFNHIPPPELSFFHSLEEVRS